jgi:hypothetical protein
MQITLSTIHCDKINLTVIFPGVSSPQFGELVAFGVFAVLTSHIAQMREQDLTRNDSEDTFYRKDEAFEVGNNQLV